MRTQALVTVLALGALAGTTVSAGAQEGPIRIGLEAPLTGSLATLGDGMLKGAQLAVEQLNDSGGVLDRQIELVPIDDGGDKTIGVPAAEAAIAAGLDGVVGPYNSGVGIQTLPLYIAAGVMPIRLTSDISTSGLGYTLQPMTYQIAPVDAEALHEWIGATNVVILSDPTQNYSATITADVQTALGEAGVTVAGVIEIAPGAGDYTDVVAQALALSPDAIFGSVYSPEGAAIAVALQAADPDGAVACLLDYASFDQTYVDGAGAAATRCDVVGVPAPDDFLGSETYVQAYEGLHGSFPGAWSPYTYDSIRFLVAGMTGAGSTEYAALEKVLDRIDGWVGWTGAVAIDGITGDRDPATVVVTSVQDLGDGPELHVDLDWAQAVNAPF